jgi:putative aldouronate transport system substrate-binding protein
MKKNFLTRFVSVTMAAVLLAASLSGCAKTGGKEDTQTGSSNTQETPSDKPDTWIADRTITVQAYVDDIGYSLPKDINNTAVMKELTKRTGIKLDVQYSPGDSDATVMASQLASGTIPDVIVSYLDNSTRPEFPLLLKAAQEGMFADVAPFMKDAKVYNHYLEEGYLPNDAYKNITFRDEFKGAAYLLPLSIPAVDRSTVYNPEDAYIGGMYIQKAIVDKLGIDPTKINTQDQLYELLVKIKEGGFKDDNGNDVYPLGPKFWGGSPDALRYIVSEYNWGVSDGYNIADDGTIKHEVETDYVFKKINYVRKLLAEGLMNPEFFTMDATRAGEVSKTHNSAIIADVHNYQDIVYESNDWVPLGPLNDFTGNNSEIKNGKTQNGVWAISSETKNPEEIFKFFDYLSTKEGQLLCEYGIEGENYTMVDGKPVLTEDTLQKLNNGDTEELINSAGASFGNTACVFFGYILTNKDYLTDFGESRPGAASSTTFKRSVEIATEYPHTYKLVQGLNAPAYLSADNMTDVKSQMDLLNYKEMLVQAMFASSDDEVNKIVDAFRQQLKSAGIEKFKEYLKQLYDQDNTTINFYSK